MDAMLVDENRSDRSALGRKILSIVQSLALEARFEKAVLGIGKEVVFLGPPGFIRKYVFWNFNIEVLVAPEIVEGHFGGNG